MLTTLYVTFYCGYTFQHAYRSDSIRFYPVLSGQSCDWRLWNQSWDVFPNSRSSRVRYFIGALILVLISSNESCEYQVHLKLFRRFERERRPLISLGTLGKVPNICLINHASYDLGAMMSSLLKASRPFLPNHLTYFLLPIPSHLLDQN